MRFDITYVFLKKLFYLFYNSSKICKKRNGQNLQNVIRNQTHAAVSRKFEVSPLFHTKAWFVSFFKGFDLMYYSENIVYS